MKDDVLGRVLERIKPKEHEQEKIKRSVDEFLAVLSPKIKPLKAFVGGSYAKDTWLSDIKDIDIFIIFPKEYLKKSAVISDILEKKISSHKPERLHGSRDYFKVYYKGIYFEIIPILKIAKANDAKNITDISPLHVKWVNSKSNEKIKDEIRILKAFLKANNLYGAESYLRGFSGYVCEILICYYRSFMNFINDASKWKSTKLIDAEHYYLPEKEALSSLNESKIAPLVLIDPVQKERNVSASVSRDVFDKLKEKAKQFIKKPELSYFEKKQFSFDDVKKKYKKNIPILLQIKPLKGKDDIIGSKILKVFDYIIDKSNDYGFEIVDKGWDYGIKRNSNIWIVFKGDISRHFEAKGPDAKNKMHGERFRDKHKKVFLRKGRLYADEMREFTAPFSFVNSIIQKDYVKERVSSIKILD
jgi:tRNA nucleotidyltransferase (CCA-adding enzyme)